MVYAGCRSTFKGDQKGKWGVREHTLRYVLMVRRKRIRDYPVFLRFRILR